MTSFGQLEFLELDIGQPVPINDPLFLHKQSPKAWVTVDKHSETQVKFREKMMKPLQVNQKLKRALSTIRMSMEKSKRPATSEEREDYTKLMGQVGEINKISKHHDKYLKEIGQLKGKDKSEKENLLEKNLSENVYRIVKLAKEGSLTRENLKQGDFASKSTPFSSMEGENVVSNQERRNKKLATQISLVEDKRIAGKQLNSNAHFRHAKRKILVLRTFGSVTNNKEQIEELYKDVEKQRLEKPAENLVRSEVLPANNFSTPKVNRRIHYSQTDNRLENKQKTLDLDTYYGNSVVLVDEPPKDGKPSFRHLKTLRTIHLPSSGELSPTTIFQETPKSNRNTQISKASTEKSTENFFSLLSLTPQNTEHQLKKNTTSEKVPSKEEKHNNFFKKSKTHLRIKDEELWNPYLDIIGNDSNSSRDNLFSRSGSQKSHYVKPEYWTPKNNKALRDELVNNLQEDRVRKSTRVPIQSFNSKKKPTKLPETLKHLRTTTPASMGFRHLNSSRSMRDISHIHLKREQEAERENSLSRGVDQRIQHMIEKSYRGDSKEDLDAEETKLILNR